MMSQDGFVHDQPTSNPNPSSNIPNKKKRNLPGTPADPDAEVIALSPKSLMATNRFLCEICNKGFQRDQNLQLHRRGHNLPWKLKQRSNKEVIRKKVYICPEKSCVHHDPCRALGDLTGVKKHYSRKHGEKKWKCEKCSKKYAVQSDWKAHSKICGTREYKCDCGTLFSRKDSFITHRAFCDALAEENARFSAISSTTNPNFMNETNNIITNNNINIPQAISRSSIFRQDHQFSQLPLENQSIINHRSNPRLPIWLVDQTTPNNSQINSNNIAFMSPDSTTLPPSHEFLQTSTLPMNIFGSSSSILLNNNNSMSSFPRGLKEEEERNKFGTNLLYLNNNIQNQVQQQGSSSGSNINPLAHMSATALLQKAAQMAGSSTSNNSSSIFNSRSFGLMNSSSNNKIEGQIRQLPISHMENNLNGLVTSLSTSSTTPTRIEEGSSTTTNSLLSSSFLANNNAKNLHSLMMQPTTSRNLKQDKVVKLQANNSFKENHEQMNLTRDFLGVGGESTSRSFFQEELAKFASMGDLSHYGTSGHH